MLISDWSSDVCSSDLIAQHSREAYGPRQHPPPPAPSERAMSERRKADEAAAAWDARLRGARASSRDRAAFQAWLKQDAEHEAAHDRLQAALSLLRANARLPELSALRDEARGSIRASRRRRLILAVSAGLAACLLLMLAGLRPERSIEVAALLQGGKVYVTSPEIGRAHV